MESSGRCASWMIVIALLVLCLPGTIQAEGPNRAGVIVVYNGGDIFTGCVEFNQAEISSADLLRGAGLDIITDSSDGLGEAICKIEDVGCDSPGDCFCQCSGSSCTYWARWVWQGATWVFAGVGGNNQPVQDGDIDAWVWGDDSMLPPTVDFNSLCIPLTVTETAQPTATGTPAPPTGTTLPGPYPSGEETATWTPNPATTSTLWPTDTPWPTGTLWPTDTPWPSATPNPTATLPGSLSQVVTTPTPAESGVSEIAPGFGQGEPTEEPTVGEVATTGSHPAVEESSSVAQSMGTATPDRVAALLATQVAWSRSTSQPLLAAKRASSGSIGPFVAIVVILMGLGGYAALLWRQRARSRL